MRTNANLTIYNKYIADRADVYLRTEITSVAWENQTGVKRLTSGGVISDDKAIIYIPFQRGSAFLSPKTWQALANEDKSDNWTLQEGDIIVKGIASDEITTEFTVSDLMAKYDDVLKITLAATFDMGSPALQHWKVGAK